MKSPVIGVTPRCDSKDGAYSVVSRYMLALRDNGAIPVMLPAELDPDRLREAVLRLDGILFTGGDDVSPDRYGEARRRWVRKLSPPRDELEIPLARLVWELDKPMLGICRGMQVVNVALGGTLYQDLRKQKATRFRHKMRKPYDRVAHTVDLLPDTPLRDLIGAAQIGVNSLHHQAVKQLAPQLQETARSSDGVMEGWYAPDKRFFFAVQWHPEYLYQKDKAAEALFRAFLRAASEEALREK